MFCMTKYERGKVVTGYVTGIEKYGIFVGLDEYYSGLIHISEISNGFVKNINDYVNIGETIKVKIIESDEGSYQVKLSIKDIDYRMTRKKKNKIQETESGFSGLSNQLQNWISKKNAELFNKTNEIKKKQKKTNISIDID